MLCLSKYAKFPKFFVNFLHESCNSFFNLTEIVIVHFLTLCRLCTK